MAGGVEAPESGDGPEEIAQRERDRVIPAQTVTAHTSEPLRRFSCYFVSSCYTRSTSMVRLHCGPGRVSPKIHHPIDGPARTRHGASIWHLLYPSSWILVAQDSPRPEPRFDSSFISCFQFSSFPSSPEILPGGRHRKRLMANAGYIYPSTILVSSLRSLEHGTTSHMGKDANNSRPSDCRLFQSAIVFFLHEILCDVDPLSDNEHRPFILIGPL